MNAVTEGKEHQQRVIDIWQKMQLDYYKNDKDDLKSYHGQIDKWIDRNNDKGTKYFIFPSPLTFMKVAFEIS